MNHSEIVRKVKYLLSFGNSKAEVYAQLSGHGVKDSQLAWVIAGQPDAALHEKHRWKVRALATLLIVESIAWMAIVAYVLTIATPAAKPGVVATLILASIPLLFAWLLSRRDGLQFTKYLVLAQMFVVVYLIAGFEPTLTTVLFGLSTGVMVPMLIVQELVSGSVGHGIALRMAILQIAYVWHVKRALFPDIGLFRAKKHNGRYVFSS